MVRRTKKESIIPLFILSMLLVIILGMMSQSLESVSKYSDNFIWLLAAGGICFLLLIFFVGHYLVKLVRIYRKGYIGSRLNVRMMLFFSGISLLPLAILLYFSITMVYKGIDSWFDASLDKGFEDALALSRSSLDIRRVDALNLTQSTGERLMTLPFTDLSFYIENVRENINAMELSVFDGHGNVVAFASSDFDKVMPERPNDVILMSVAQGMEYVVLEQVSDSQLRVRVVTKIAENLPYILQAFYEIPDKYTELANSTKNSVEYYKQFKSLRAPLKMNLLVILGLVALLSILLALGGSFFASRRLVNPIRDLSIATKAVAEGDLERKIKVKSRDEIGFLTSSFNEMTQKLKHAHEVAQKSQGLLEAERAHLASLLEKLSSGVLVIDELGKVRVFNNAALTILGVTEDDLDHLTLASLKDAPEALRSFIAPLFDHLKNTTEKEWRTEISRYHNGSQQILSVRGSEENDQIGLKGGKIVVFDDITQLISGERESAWSEVARRLAHEIKNPLTPIQLSAERMKLRFSEKMVDKDKEIIDKSTETIIAQVKALKTMVDDFSQYAKSSQQQLVELDLKKLVKEVMYLYQDYPAALEIRTMLADTPAYILGDSLRLRQLLHNLVKNAIEACPDQTGEIDVSLTSDDDWVVLKIKDTGIGFDQDQMAKIFEPYVTTKSKGTGLGLAIVKKIIEEHHGKIAIYSEGKMMGAEVVIQLPKIVK
ncbi:ATP-binding protein [Wohlfahrtiimonas sp. G9077]|uniref:sensor histidine kinase n=1 Tax=Wohlfahrtiimonas sp. G9077 TaxID=1980118 RepID=UPI000B984898|nr:ATP-binding protein [Wohlfahrtiimonas sp. G9077]OYQ75176.1 PAS domain S-box protein [Wohlfahrtiimonas sp. G9077]